MHANNAFTKDIKDLIPLPAHPLGRSAGTRNRTHDPAVGWRIQ